MFAPWTTAWTVIALLLAPSVGVDAYGYSYVPGVPLRDFERGDDTELRVNSMTSIHTQIPRDFYHLQYCIPGTGPLPKAENLGESLTGNKIQNSLFYLQMHFPVSSCRILCRQTYTVKGARDFHWHIKKDYHHNWIVDNLVRPRCFPVFCGMIS